MPMKRGPRPVFNSRDIAMFDGIEMDVIEMPFKIRFVAYDVFMISTLPDSSVPTAFLRCGHRFFMTSSRQPIGCEAIFDGFHTSGVIGIPVRQSHKAM